MNNWIRRNWFLVPVILVATVVLIKGLIELLPEVQLPTGVSNLDAPNLDQLYTNPVIWAVGVVILLVLISLNGQNWLRAILLGGLAVAMFIFRGQILGWDWATTSLGMYVNETFGSGSAVWLWLVPLIAAILLWKLTGPKTSSSDRARTESDPIGAFFGLIILLVVGTVALGATAVLVMIAEEATDASEKYERFRSGEKKAPTPEDRGCETKDTSTNLRIDEGGKKVKVCRDVGEFFLIPEYGHRLSFKISESFLRENEEVQKRNLGDFVVIQEPKTYNGSLEESYRISPKVEFGSAFDKSGLNEIVIFVEAYDPRNKPQ